MVSVMFSGAGSVEVSARAIFATTEATSGNCWMAAFCFLVISMACGSEIAGSVTGMNIRSPSLRGGMNSRPMRGHQRDRPRKHQQRPRSASGRGAAGPSGAAGDRPR